MLRTLREIQRVLKAGGEVTFSRPRGPLCWMEVKVRVCDDEGRERWSSVRTIDLDLVEQYLEPHRDILGEVVRACYDNIQGAQKRREPAPGEGATK